MSNQLIEKFKKVGQEYRGIPFWSWNDKLQKDEIVRQIHEMKKQGMGGFFMHSREGLETVYMGDEWMECIKAAVSTAKELNMSAWLYDEDRWPSGGAGGLVPAKGGDDFRSKAIEVIKIENEFFPDSRVLGLYKMQITEGELNKFEILNHLESYTAIEGEYIVTIRVQISNKGEWFNNDAPVDNLNPDAVKCFLETTYEAYKDEVGLEFGKTIPGVFTDEPGVAYFIPHDSASGEVLISRLPWSSNFPSYFTKMRSYDLLEFLPFLFFEHKQSKKIRHDFWRTLAELFVESFSKQIGDWAEVNNLAFTGHFMQENDLWVSTKMCGAIMPHFEYQHVPGIDMLCEQTDEYLTVKQCVSVANQFGRKHVLTETYGCTGWKFTFEGQKWVGDWQYILGVTLRCQHLALYSLRGCRKRDYPPAFSYNTSWWKFNHVMEDYFARFGLMLSEGKAVRDLLIIHPLTSIWTIMSDINESEVKKLSGDFNQLSKSLCAMHFDHDFGDELIIEKWGCVFEDKLKINKAAYKVVLLPKFTSLFKSTLSLLTKFIESGGKVVSMTRSFVNIEGETSDEMSKDIEKFLTNSNVFFVDELSQIQNALESVLARDVSIIDENGFQAQKILYMHRDDDERHIYGFINNDLKSMFNVTIILDFVGEPEEWDLLTGETKKVSFEIIDGKTVLKAEFLPVSSKIFVLTKKDYPSLNYSQEENRKVVKSIQTSYFGPKSRFKRTWPNALTLDNCRFSLDGSNWSEKMPVWQAQRIVREKLGMIQVYKNRLPQRYKWIDIKHQNDGALVKLLFEFDVENLITCELFLVIERSKEFNIFINDELIDCKPQGWYLDKSLKKIPLVIKKGQNLIKLECNYKNDMELEDVYIIGDFGVDVITRSLIKEPVALYMGDWCQQGFPHYCGSMVYIWEYEVNCMNKDSKYVLTLGEFSAVVIEIKVNQNIVGHIPWKASNGLEITNAIIEGTNLIEVEVMGSPRNLLGPLHLAQGHRRWTDWSVFRTEAQEFCDEYVYHPYGLMGQCKIDCIEV